eukprot:6203013-Pleurochrysis_carterae.AAC.1
MPHQAAGAPSHHARQPALQSTPDSERALARHIAILQASQVEDGVPGLSGKIAGLKYDLDVKRKDRKRRADQF